MLESPRAELAGIGNIDSSWRSLLRVGGAAALTVIAFMVIQIFIFITWPPPSTAIDWFSLFQNNALVGLLDMDLLLIADYVLLALMNLALWAALQRENQAFMTTALILQVIGTATYFASTVAFEMLSLSHHYAVASTEAERSMILAAGEVMVVTWQGTAFNVSYILGAFSMLIVSIVMLRSNKFGKLAAYAGILGGAAGLVPPTVGPIGMLFSLASLLPMTLWLILIARGLFQLGRANSQESPQH